MMKKLFLAAFLMAGTFFANAQDSEMGFGVKAGFTSLSSKVEFAGISGTDSDSGFYLGGFADIAISEKFIFHPELLYVSVSDLNQIQLPLHAKYMITEDLGALAGPNLAFLMDTAEGIKSFNYGIDLGASYNIDENFVVDARYNIGLANLVEDGDSDNSLKLSGFYIGVGYRF